jgi:hypothetical protein
MAAYGNASGSFNGSDFIGAISWSVPVRFIKAPFTKAQRQAGVVDPPACLCKDLSTRPGQASISRHRILPSGLHSMSVGGIN